MRGKDVGATKAVQRIPLRGTERQQAPAVSKAKAAPKPKALSKLEKLQKQAADLKAEGEELDAEVAAMEKEAEEAEAAAAEAAKDALEGEQELTERTAAMSLEYTAREAELNQLEAEHNEVEATLEAQRAKNVVLTKRTYELDCETKSVKLQLTSAEAEVKRISKSQDELDDELQRGEEACERVKLKAKKMGEQCGRDLERTGELRENLLEVCGGLPSEDAQLLLNESADRMAQVKEVQLYCEHLHLEGPLPQPNTTSERCSMGCRRYSLVE